MKAFLFSHHHRTRPKRRVRAQLAFCLFLFFFSDPAKDKSALFPLPREELARESVLSHGIRNERYATGRVHGRQGDYVLFA